MIFTYHTPSPPLLKKGEGTISDTYCSGNAVTPRLPSPFLRRGAGGVVEYDGDAVEYHGNVVEYGWDCVPFTP